jgi:hypothetical protein
MSDERKKQNFFHNQWILVCDLTIDMELGANVFG